MKKLGIWKRAKARVKLLIGTGITTIRVKEGDLIVVRTHNLDAIDIVNDELRDWLSANELNLMKTKIMFCDNNTDFVILRTSDEKQ